MRADRATFIFAADEFIRVLEWEIMNALVKDIENKYLKREVPEFRPGDQVRVAVRIVEGNRERIQNFEGVVIARHGEGMNATFTVRRVSFGVGMERTFSLHSPRIEGVTVLRHGHVRRSKLYYLRELSGKKARISDTRRKRSAKGTMVQLLEENPPEPESPVAEEILEAEAVSTEAEASQTETEAKPESEKKSE